MKITRQHEANVTHLKAVCGVRYWEDATVNGQEDGDGTRIPCRIGDDWCPVIELATGIIQGWPEGTTASLYYKVCDAGLYQLMTEDGDVAAQIDGYVPSMMSPGGNGFGDYVIMEIDGSGKIAGWSVDLSEFEGEGR